MKVLPISENKKFKYSIYFQSFDEESLEMGSSVDSGYEKIESIDTIGDILRLANSTYGIYYPVSFGVWESTEPLQNTEYFEKGIRKYFSLHIHNEDGTEISSDENDFITFLLSDGQYNSDVFEEYAIGGVVLGALLGVGALITYFYFKNKKGSDSYTSTNPRAKSVVRNINGKDRKFPIKDAWRNEHNIENKRENYEVPQGQRLNKFELGGDASEYYHEIEYGQGGVAKAKDIIMNKIGWNENIADYLVSKSEKFAIWLADSILKREIEIRREPKSNVLYALNERAISINTNFLNNYYSTEIREILDWLQHPLTPKQELKQLSFEQALEKAREWHEELEVLGGDVDFIEPDTNIILKTYPKNKEGIEYYWSLIPSNYCDLESSRMGHCGRTGYNNQLISLRSIRPYGQGHTINDSHVTIAYGKEDGLFKQIKGKKNNKPSEKYFPYIFDLIKSISDGQINKKLEEIRFKKEGEIKDEIQKVDSLANELSQEVPFNIYSPSSNELAFLKGERELVLESRSMSVNPLSFVSEESFIGQNVRKIYRLQNRQQEVRNNRDYYGIESEIDGLLKENLDYYRYIIVEKYKEYEKLNKLVNAQRQTISTLMFDGFGSEYASENDYGFEDMTDEELRELFKINPSVFSSAKSLLFLFDKNIISKEEYIEIASKYDDFNTYVIRLELFNRGIVSEKPSTIFKLNYSCGEVDRLLNSSGNTSLVEGLLCGDFDDEYYDNFSYYFDNPSDLVDNLDKENSKRIIDEIVRITNYDESEVIENGINYYLNGEDENFTKDDFDGICRSLANAQNYADRDDYYVYAQKELRSAIEELGKVEYLDDRGLSIEIDLLDFQTEKEIAEKMDYWEFESISDLFEELVSADAINLPRFEIDDRYSPYGDTKVFNDYLSDSDLETYNKGGKLKTKNTIKKNKIKTMNSLDSEFKGGGNVGAISKTKIVITENKEENKIQATRTLVKENSEGEKITYELLVGKHTDKESKPNRYADGWFEIYATDEDDNEYFYAEGGLWLQGNKVVDYDGVYELSEKLRPLMSALNMNSSEVFSEGGAVKSKRKKKRQPKVTRIQFEEENYEFENGGGVDGVIVYDNDGETFDRYTIFTPDGSVYGMSDNALMPNGFNQYLGDNTEVEKGSHLGKKLKSIPESIKVAVERRMSEYEGGGEAGDWSVTDISNAKYLGVIEFEDNEGEFHNFEIMETDDRLVFGGMTNSGFIESGYIEKDGFSTDETLQSLLEDLEVYYNEGAKYTSQIVFNQRMSKGGAVKSKRRKKRQPKVTRIQFEEGNYEYAYGGQASIFDRYAMNESTIDEIKEMTNYPMLKEYFVEENGEKKYVKINSELEKAGVSINAIKNYLSGLYYGHNWSNSDGFKEEMAKLKLVDINFYNRVMEMYDKVSKYPLLEEASADSNKKRAYHHIVDKKILDRERELRNEIQANRKRYLQTDGNYNYVEDNETRNQLQKEYLKLDKELEKIDLQIIDAYINDDRIDKLNKPYSFLRHNNRLLYTREPKSISKKITDIYKKYKVLIDEKYANRALKAKQQRGYGALTIGTFIFGINDSVKAELIGGTALELGEYLDKVKKENKEFFKANKKYAGGGGVDDNDYSGKYSSLRDFLDSNKGMEERLSEIYSFESLSMDELLNGDLEDNEITIKDLLRGKGYDVNVIDDENDGYIQVTKITKDGIDGVRLLSEEEKEEFYSKGLEYFGIKEGDLIEYEYLGDGNDSFNENEAGQEFLVNVSNKELGVNAQINPFSGRRIEFDSYEGGGKALKEYYWIKMERDKIEEYINYASRMMGMFEGEIYTQAPNKVAFDTEDDMFHFTSMLENDDIEYEELFNGEPRPNIFDKILSNKYEGGGGVDVNTSNGRYQIKGASHYASNIDDVLYYSTDNKNEIEKLIDLALDKWENTKFDKSKSVTHIYVYDVVNDENVYDYAGGGETYQEKISELKGGIKEYSVDIDLESGDTERELTNKSLEKAKKLFDKYSETMIYNDEKIENIQLVAVLKNGDYETLDSKFSDEFSEGGEILEWMEEALISLMEETGNGDLEITYVSNDGTEFYATDNDVEYRVFKTEDDAERVAVEQVREDMEETPENFNQDFIAGYVDGRDFFTEALNEMNYSYANDIQTESDDRYENRLIAEMVENGLMDEEDAESGNADELADYYKDDYVSLLTEGQLNEGANGLQHFIDNFGEEEAMRMVIENNLIDIERASTDAVRVDGIAHFLSSYDGETLYLSNNYVAYRIN